MKLKQTIAGVLLASSFALLIPATPALADGRASTRNILLGVGAAAAATYLIIQHNRKVHEHYAQDARQQAELESENNDAWAAYSSEKNAYANESAEVSDLKREVAYQHQVVEQQRHELSMAGRSDSTAFQTPASSGRRISGRPPSGIAMVSYGWGTI